MQVVHVPFFLTYVYKYKRYIPRVYDYQVFTDFTFAYAVTQKSCVFSGMVTPAGQDMVFKRQYRDQWPF